MTLIEAAKRALEALEHEAKVGNDDAYRIERDALTQAIADAEQQEPRKALTQPDGCQCPACKVTPHASDCAVHNEPAYSKGTCNCKAQPEQQEPRELNRRFT